MKDSQPTSVWRAIPVDGRLFCSRADHSCLIPHPRNRGRIVQPTRRRGMVEVFCSGISKS
jgi:hypothetical protein